MYVGRPLRLTAVFTGIVGDMQVRRIAMGWLLVALLAGVAHAQVSSSMMFCVNVASALSLQPPAGPIKVLHDGGSGDLPLGITQWPCVANGAGGAVVTFSTLTGFVHETILTSMRDVKLTLAIASSDAGAGWSVTTPTDQTDVTAIVPDLQATVQAESNAPGNAVFDLSVTFVTDNLATLSPGEYCTTIVGTITPK